MSDDYEKLPTQNFSIYLIAGAIAGTLELCLMYPIDSVKTRMQSLSPEATSRKSLRQILKAMIKEEGIFRPVRGIEVIVISAGPSHALYFASYEYVKNFIVDNKLLPLYAAACVSGTVAATLHDAVTNPAEVIKQRMQMANSPYKTIIDCGKTIYQKEGFGAFYKSFTTNLAMNIPFHTVHFVGYEFCQNVMNPGRKYDPKAHLISGAIAGGLAATITTPLDVCKTLPNTQERQVTGMMNAVKTIYEVNGLAGFFKGVTARVVYQMPSTAICWTVYELFKYILAESPKGKKPENFCY